MAVVSQHAAKNFPRFHRLLVSYTEISNKKHAQKTENKDIRDVPPENESSDVILKAKNMKTNLPAW